ncbi:hypothetical protein NDU88_003652 [Pleurodeles waltl]|uniref:Uncharacterized protein n=1 Tax=Pleurodeles waltl TaxID=8319 RepID=A0AAV7VE01_PLEWA|nr:hypothetical protein NDU88_003652 [Pleurodeles waltl]
MGSMTGIGQEDLPPMDIPWQLRDVCYLGNWYIVLAIDLGENNVLDHLNKIMSITSRVEVCTCVANIISIIVAITGIVIYAVEFALFGLTHNPFLHRTGGEMELTVSYALDCVILALLAFELGLSIWILSIFLYAEKRIPHASN